MKKSKTKAKKLTRSEIEALENWKKLNAKWDKIPKWSRQSKSTPDPEKTTLTRVGPVVPAGRETTSVRSRTSSGRQPQATVNPPKKYTGTAIVGIATLHKSVAVPVFSKEDAVDISKMRRG